MNEQINECIDGSVVCKSRSCLVTAGLSCKEGTSTHRKGHEASKGTFLVAKIASLDAFATIE